MRKVIIILFLCIPIAANAANYYVATNGNDNNPGTLSQPWATWQKGFNAISPGDILYVRGGTYRTSYASSSDRFLFMSNRIGTALNPISIFAYQNEVPVFNLDNIYPTNGSYAVALMIQSCQYVHIKGLRITGLQQPTSGIPVWGMGVYGSPHLTFEHVDIDNIGGYGVSLFDGSDDILFKNCDAHHCVDKYSGYENANGFNITGGSTATNITFNGCRAWKCSDDGFDFLRSDAVITLNNCWSFWNGYDDSFNDLGDGQGFKLGPSVTNKSATHLRTLTNCIAVKNKSSGFDQNTTDYSCIYYFYNNVAYDNGLNGWDFDYLDGIANIFRNNIAYGNDNSETQLGTGTVQDHNTWNGGVTVTTADFVSVVVSLLESARQSNGDLPVIDFLHLVQGSDLINKGVNTGLPFASTAPDLGAFEQGAYSTSVVSPVYKSGVIENTTPALLVMAYDLSLNNLVLPATSSFTVLVNSTVRTVNSVAISGNKVQLTLVSAIKYGDIISVSYTKPASNPLQTSAGGIASNISTQLITNNLSTHTANATLPEITMTINPNPVHRITNILFTYASTFSKQDPESTPQIIKIMDLSGKLFIEKLLVTGVASIKFPINLRSGIYIVMVLLGSQDISSQKIIVY